MRFERRGEEEEEVGFLLSSEGVVLRARCDRFIVEVTKAWMIFLEQ